MKNAFEKASFWWQLSLTTLFSNTFHGAFHAREGFLSSELSACQAEQKGDSFLWTQAVRVTLVNGISKKKMQSRGRRMSKASLLPSQAPPIATCSTVSPFCLFQDYSTEEKSLVERALSEYLPNGLSCWGCPFVWSERNSLNYLLCIVPSAVLILSWIFWVLLIDKGFVAIVKMVFVINSNKREVQGKDALGTHTKRVYLNTVQVKK